MLLYRSNGRDEQAALQVEREEEEEYELVLDKEE